MHENNARRSRNLRRIAVLSVVLIGVVAFRLISAPERKSRLANRAPRRSASHHSVVSPQPVREQHVAPPFDPSSLAVDLKHLWSVNPFHTAAQPEHAAQTAENATPADPDDPDGGTDREVLALHTGIGDLRVSAILDNGRARAAIIGNRVVRQGDLVDGRLQVVAIHPDRVEVVAAVVAAEPDSSAQPADSPHQLNALRGDSMGYPEK